MTIPIDTTVVLDLDDTLYPEIDFLKSAYAFIAENVDPKNTVLYKYMLAEYFAGENVFQDISEKYNIDISILLNWYRLHSPTITLYPNVREFIDSFKHSVYFSLVTDGRSKTQRNKLKALAIYDDLQNIIISEELGTEKPNPNNFRQAIKGLNTSNNFYIGDNINKDFITPNTMEWTTICLKDLGQNIHKQDFNKPDKFLPRYYFESWSEIHNFFTELY